MLVLGLQRLCQLLRTAQADGRALGVEQQGWAWQRRQVGQVTQATVGEDQQALAFARFRPLPTRQPVTRLLQRIEQRRAATGAQFVKPSMQFSTGLAPLPQPLRLTPTGLQHGQARTLAIGAVENLGEHALGQAQGTMAASRGGGIDQHQPQRVGLLAARAQHQLFAALRPALAQSRRPVDTTGHAATRSTTQASAESSGPVTGIRASGCARADAQGFFGQRGGTRRSPMACGCAGNSPH